MKRNMELRDEWAAPAIQGHRPARLVGRASSLPHLILPVVSLVFGLSFLVGVVHWLNDRNVPDPQSSFVIGAVFTALGGFELRYWWRRLQGK